MTFQYRTLPTYNTPLAVAGNVHKAWFQAFQQRDLGVPPAKETAVTPTGSPYTYTAPRGGFLIVTGGTVSSITYSRSGTFYATGQTSGTFTMSQYDQLKITYSAAPTLTWVPT